MDIRRVFLADTRLSALIDQYAEGLRFTMDSALNGWYRDVAQEAGSLAQREGRVLATNANASRARAAGRRLRSSMDQAMAPVLNDATIALSRLAAQAAQAMESTGRGGPITPEEANKILMFIQMRVRDLDGSRLVDDVGRVLVRATSAGQDLGEVLYESRELVDDTLTRLQTAFDTMAGEVVQMVAGLRSKVTDAYLYSGPVDNRIRPWCLAHVARVWSRKAIDRMNNGQLPNTFLTRGGYNCRHWWRPVAETALVRLVDTGAVVPGMVAAVGSMARARAAGGVRIRRAS